MNWSLILTSMLPEHLLLAGMLAILGLEIRSGRPSDGFGFAVIFVAAAAVAALWLYATGFNGAPFLHHFSVDPASASSTAFGSADAASTEKWSGKGTPWKPVA